MKELLKNRIRQGYTTLDECYEIGVGHKQSYIERELRHICENSPFKPVKNGKGYIVGYELEKPTQDNLDL